MLFVLYSKPLQLQLYILFLQRIVFNGILKMLKKSAEQIQKRCVHIQITSNFLTIILLKLIIVLFYLQNLIDSNCVKFGHHILFVSFSAASRVERKPNFDDKFNFN